MLEKITTLEQENQVLIDENADLYEIEDNNDEIAELKALISLETKSILSFSTQKELLFSFAEILQIEKILEEEDSEYKDDSEEYIKEYKDVDIPKNFQNIDLSDLDKEMEEELEKELEEEMEKYFL